ncbi:MAG: acyl-CoA dehydratase activase-related protein [bacterium]
MRIGLPKSLLYYYYYPFWAELFEKLDLELVVSDSTSADILNRGVKESISEICVPMKVYIGQIFNLLDKKVDYIYIPRFVSIKKGITFCPKFLGLPDMIRNSFPEIEGKIMTHHIKSNNDDISNYDNYIYFKEIIGLSDKKIKSALEIARNKWIEYRNLQKQGYKTIELLNENKETFNDTNKDVTIGLLGYVYNIYDNYINMDLLSRLDEMGAKVITFDMLEDNNIDNYLKKYRKKMFWEFTNKLLGAGHFFMDRRELDGIIHVTAFGCGPDSILGPFLEMEAEEKNKPFMTLRIDEQTGESHLITRIEAFIDLLKLNKRRERI